MPYDPNKVPFNTSGDDAFGSAGYTITPNDSVDQTDPDGNYYKYFVAQTDGNVSCLGYKNEDADPAIPYVLSAGDVLPIRARRIFATGTTATITGHTS